MEALEETWRNLQKIIKERDIELQKEWVEFLSVALSILMIIKL